MLKNEKGATLAELLAVLIISSLIIGTITFVIQYTTDNYRATSERQLVQADAMFVIETIIKSVRERSNQSLHVDDDKNCVLKLEINTTDYTCFQFNDLDKTLRILKNNAGSTTMNQIISDKLHKLNVEIIGNKIVLKLDYIIMNNKDFSYETSVYIPYL